VRRIDRFLAELELPRWRLTRTLNLKSTFSRNGVNIVSNNRKGLRMLKVRVKRAINLGDANRAKQKMMSATELDSRKAAYQAILEDSTVEVAFNIFTFLPPKRWKRSDKDKINNSTRLANNKYEKTVSDFVMTNPIKLIKISNA